MRGALISSEGGKKQNTDAYGRSKIGRINCFVIADAMDGRPDAAQIAVDAVLDSFDNNPSVSRKRLFTHLTAANTAVMDMTDEGFGQYKETVSIAVLVTDGDRSVYATCGNCRIYRFKKRLITEVSEDDTTAFDAFMAGKIRYSQIRMKESRRRITQAIGISTEFEPNISDVIKLPDKSSFLLCTDGFWEIINEDYMEKARKRAESPREWLSILDKEYKLLTPIDADSGTAVAVYI